MVAAFDGRGALGLRAWTVSARCLALLSVLVTGDCRPPAIGICVRLA
jgi:hypothetical protein